jgi:hypothetical protein
MARQTRQVSLVLPEEIVELADRLIEPLQNEDLFRGSVEVTRALVLRIGVADGLQALAEKYLKDQNVTESELDDAEEDEPQEE